LGLRRLFAFLLLLLALAVSSLLAAGPVLSQLGEALSPAQGDASVVAHGIASLPDGQLGWRVTRAASPAGADQTQDNPGFLLTESGALLVNDVERDAWTRLAPGEALYLPDGTRYGEGATGGPQVSFFRIDLVDAAEVAVAGDDELLFIGEPFPSPGGNRDIDLVRNVLDPSESVTLGIQADAAPVLFLVASGTVELVPAGNDAATPVSLSAGQGAALSGDVVVTATEAGASFVTAVVGPDVPLTLAQEAEPTATPTPEPASLTVQVLACPVAYEGTNYGADCVDPVPDVTIDLNSATGAFAQGTTGGDGTISFVELIPDTYTLSGGVPGEFAQQVIACADTAGALETGASDTLAAGATFTVEGGDAVACQWYVIPENLRGEGSIAIAAYVCPGTPLDPAADCTAIDASGSVVIGPDGAAVDPSAGLPFGTYFLQTGGIAVPARYELSEVRGSGGAADIGWSVLLDEASPEAALAIIYVPTGGRAGNTDEDTDGLSDAQEAELGTDPANPDTDGDGLFDGPEVAAGTDPTLYDSDGDGFGDNQEAAGGSDALDPASVPEGGSGIDTDGDLLSDAEEEILGTNAALPDTDGDGLTDFAEVGFEPGSATGSDPRLFDTDGDGVGDGDEIANGTDPLNPASS
jgi:hypothetical protein